jgi:hypothetical protein
MNLTKRRMLVAATRFQAAVRYGSPQLIARTWFEYEAAKAAYESEKGGDGLQEKSAQV